ncbi:MAG: copper amine oxidase N-terminal domain-containing protein, partial [Firmicutes bacterium]|nr:copper amine oxidase N-terminal domain-containing protein [Bacillota bacterium]
FEHIFKGVFGNVGELIAILATLALLATLLVPMATPALADTSYTVLRAYPVTTGADKDLGLVLVKGEVGALKKGDVVTFKLPSDFSVSSVTYGNTQGNGDIDIYTPVDADGGTGNNALSGGKIQASLISSDRTVRVEVVSDPTAGKKSYMYIAFQKVDVPSTFSGVIEVIVSASSGFSSGTIQLGTVGSGKGNISIDSVKNITASSTSLSSITIAETTQGGLKESTTSVKLTLPKGYKWTNANGTALTQLWGDRVATIDSKDNDDRTLIIAVDTSTNKAKTAWTFTPQITVDEATANFGDVEMTVGGDSSIEPTSLIVAKYVDYGVTVIENEVKDVLAGRKDQKLGTFFIEEAAPGSLIKGRSITLKLPDNAKWAAAPSIEYVKGSTNVLGSATQVDSRTYKFNVDNSSDSATKIKFKDLKVNLAVDVAGELKIKIGGSAGAEGEVKVANVLAPVTASVAGVNDVKIGVQAQEVQDITITETKKEALIDDKNLEVVAPTGVSWAATPTVTVTEGDVDLGTVKVDGSKLSIKIDGQSSKASTIKISGIKLTIDRTVPEGALVLKVEGDAVTETATTDLFETATTAAKVTAAKCVTPAPGEQKATVVFTINNTAYTVNGVEKTMDAAPYIKNGRTFIPVRYAAEACGVTSDNILYSEGKVTLIKGDKVVQLTIGSNVMLINGTPITMDVAPEIVDPGRTMLPFRWLAQALGAKVSWDEAAQTVTMEI